MFFDLFLYSSMIFFLICMTFFHIALLICLRLLQDNDFNLSFLFKIIISILFLFRLPQSKLGKSRDEPFRLVCRPCIFCYYLYGFDNVLLHVLLNKSNQTSFFISEVSLL